MSSIEVQNETFNNHINYKMMLRSKQFNDGLMQWTILHVAQLGNRGTHGGNANRELKHRLGGRMLPKPMMATVFMVIPKPATGEAMSKDVMLPILFRHETILHVRHNHLTWLSSLSIREQNEQDTPCKLDEAL